MDTSTDISTKIKCPNKRLKPDKMIEKRSTSALTDPECLGPCDPGSSVVLEGIVWNESRNGLLVVNVTWRGKTYVGTLMDSSNHDWASPSFKEEFVLADLVDAEDEATTDARRLRKCRTPRTSNKAKLNQTSEPTTPPSSTPTGEDPVKAASSKDITCPEVDCMRRFRHLAALRNHRCPAQKRSAKNTLTNGHKEDNKEAKVSEIYTQCNGAGKDKLLEQNNDTKLNTNCENGEKQDREYSIPNNDIFIPGVMEDDEKTIDGEKSLFNTPNGTPLKSKKNLVDNSTNINGRKPRRGRANKKSGSPILTVSLSRIVNGGNEWTNQVPCEPALAPAVNSRLEDTTAADLTTKRQKRPAEEALDYRRKLIETRLQSIDENVDTSSNHRNSLWKHPKLDKKSIFGECDNTSELLGSFLNGSEAEDGGVVSLQFCSKRGDACLPHDPLEARTAAEVCRCLDNSAAHCLLHLSTIQKNAEAETGNIFAQSLLAKT